MLIKTEYLAKNALFSRGTQSAKSRFMHFLNINCDFNEAILTKKLEGTLKMSDPDQNCT